ncbi:hypothetical protein ACT3UJ_03450 [Halomonas sp. 86]|uniref:hypothetical protein n=1 Tax=unclassified Halomonas TaxID=2609666 RepID=UPI0040335682
MIVEQVVTRRQQLQTYRQIAQARGIGQSTVARLLKREGLNRLAVRSLPAPVPASEAEPRRTQRTALAPAVKRIGS